MLYLAWIIIEILEFFILLRGALSQPWVYRGGHSENASVAGVFSFYARYGDASVGRAFRLVLVARL